MSCDNRYCSKHGKCLVNGHDLEIVSDRGVSNRCRTCGKLNVMPIELSHFEEASLVQKLAGMYTEEGEEFKGIEFPWSD